MSIRCGSTLVKLNKNRIPIQVLYDEHPRIHFDNEELIEVGPRNSLISFFLCIKNFEVAEIFEPDSFYKLLEAKSCHYKVNWNDECCHQAQKDSLKVCVRWISDFKSCIYAANSLLFMSTHDELLENLIRKLEVKADADNENFVHYEPMINLIKTIQSSVSKTNIHNLDQTKTVLNALRKSLNAYKQELASIKSTVKEETRRKKKESKTLHHAVVRRRKPLIKELSLKLKNHHFKTYRSMISRSTSLLDDTAMQSVFGGSMLDEHQLLQKRDSYIPEISQSSSIENLETRCPEDDVKNFKSDLYAMDYDKQQSNVADRYSDGAEDSKSTESVSLSDKTDSHDIQSDYDLPSSICSFALKENTKLSQMKMANLYDEENLGEEMAKTISEHIHQEFTTTRSRISDELYFSVDTCVSQEILQETPEQHHLVNTPTSQKIENQIEAQFLAKEISDKIKTGLNQYASQIVKIINCKKSNQFTKIQNLSDLNVHFMELLTYKLASHFEKTKMGTQNNTPDELVQVLANRIIDRILKEKLSLSYDNVICPYTRKGSRSHISGCESSLLTKNHCLYTHVPLPLLCFCSIVQLPKSYLLRKCNIF